MLRASGARLIRQKKHLVYQLPNGRRFVMAKTPSDGKRAGLNQIGQLRRLLEGKEAGAH